MGKPKIKTLFASILSKENKVSRSIIIAITVLVVFSSINFLLFDQNPTTFEASVLVAIEALTISFLVSILYAIPERLGIMVNIENSVSSEIRSVKRSIENLIRGRYKYGLTGVSESMDEQEIIKKLGKGDKVRWLNTRLETFNSLEPDILSAVERGADIKILLLSCESEAAKFRWEEVYAIKGSSLEEYRKKLDSQLNDAKALVELAKDLKGRVSIKFYDGLPCMPMFIVTTGDHKQAHTGFYLNETSNRTPYLEWETSLEDPFITSLEKYFDQKWPQDTMEKAQV